MIKEIRILPLSIFLLLSIKLFAGLVDTSGNPVTNETQLGDIDMKVSTFGDVKQHVMTTNMVQEIVTNSTVVGYSDWKYSGNVSYGTQYSITMTEPNYTFVLHSLSPYAQLATVTTNVMNPTYLQFDVSGGAIYANRAEIRRNTNGLAMYSDVESLEEKIDSMDTSYIRTVGLTNINQSVQYVYTEAGVTSLSIQMPTNGMTKDWLVYVLPTEDLELVLPPANYWVTSEATTNSIPALTPTALYFSQINDDTYSIGRQELVPITIQTPLSLMMKSIHDRMKNKVRHIKK